MIILEEYSSPATQGNSIRIGTTEVIRIMDGRLLTMAAPLHKKYVWLNVAAFKFYLNYKYRPIKAPAKCVYKGKRHELINPMVII